MNILIDIGHPAHVHLFKKFAIEMIEKGHFVFFTVREKEFEIQLLKTFNFQYKILGKHHKTKIGKLWGLFFFTLRLFFWARQKESDVFLSHGSMYAALASWLLRKPHISFEDTFNFEQIKLYKPFTTCILTSNYQHPDLGHKNIQYSGYHELAYLHPAQFSPNPKVLQELNLKKDDTFSIVRFVSWNASHDTGHKGISLKNKITLIKELQKYGTVLLSSESALPEELKDFEFPLEANKIHDAMAFASLVFGESATMASEAAVLGTPAIYLDNTGRLYTTELQSKYKLVFNYTESESDQIAAIEKASEILSSYDIAIWEKRKKALFEEKIDVTRFLVWFISEFPASMNKMQKNPDIQRSFLSRIT